VPGSVLLLEPETTATGRYKVPHIGWSRIHQDHGDSTSDDIGAANGHAWEGSPLDSTANGEFMYFTHSFYAELQDTSLAVSWSRYGGVEFCSSLQWGNVFGCQFHPERSGPAGLTLYRNLASIISGATRKKWQSM